MSASAIDFSSSAEKHAWAAQPASLWRPTIADLLVLALIAWTFLVAPNGTQELVSDANTGMHIRTGDWIRATGAVPYTDLYSFSRAGEPWFAWEWLTAVIYSLLNQAFGLPGVELLSIFALGATFAVTLRTMVRSGAVAIVAVPFLFLAFRAASIHFLSRPHLFTWIFLGITVAMVTADRARPGRRVWFLVPLSLLWTNTHGGFLTLPVYLGLVAAGSLAERNFARFRRYALLAAATGAVTLLNPYGWNVHQHIWTMLNSKWLTEMVQEFQPPWTLADERIYIFYGLATLATIAAAGLAKQRQFTAPMLIAFFLYAAMRSVRHVPLFLIVALPPMAAYYSRLWLRWAGRASRKSTLAILDQISADATPQMASLSLLGVALLVLGFAVPGHFGLPADFSPKTFPVQFLAQHAGKLRQTRLMTHDNWADYLIFHAPQSAAHLPRQKFWIDGRQDFFGPEFGEQYFALVDAEPKAAEILDRWKFTAILIKPSTKLAVWLKTRPEWQEQARDSQAVLFLKRG